MAITDCSKHGHAHFTEICSHVVGHIDRGRYGSFHRINMFPSGLLVCDECLGKYGLARFINHPGLIVGDPPWTLGGPFHLVDEQAYDEYCEAYESFTDRHICCDECIAAAEVSQARSEGKPDPFPVYERTLTSHQRKRVGELESYLTRHFGFKASVVDPGRHELALFLEPGHYRQPLTVRTYYVVTRAEQDGIVALVSEFLSGQVLNQARVQFWEAEVWETGTNPQAGVSWGRRGRETLLREEFVNSENERMQL